MKIWQFILLLILVCTFIVFAQNNRFKIIAERNSNEFNNQSDINIVVISDLNSEYGSTEYEPEIDRAIALIRQWQPDLVLCSGDMIAGQKPSLSKSQIEAMWSAFDAHVAAPLRAMNIPFGFTIGNHDGSGAIVKSKLIFVNERELASTYWNDPQHDPGLNFIDRANFPFYYSFQLGNIFYLVWDASTHKIAPQQLAWVKQTLASQAAQQAKLRLAIGHLPLYPVAAKKNKPGEYLAAAEQLRSLLETAKVHTYISGHHHAYYPGYKGKLQLLNTGALGQGSRQLIGSDLPPRQTITTVKIQLTKAETTYTTYDIKTMELIDIETLPRRIDGDNGFIFRRDINQ